MTDERRREKRASIIGWSVFLGGTGAASHVYLPCDVLDASEHGMFLVFEVMPKEFAIGDQVVVRAASTRFNFEREATIRWIGMSGRYHQEGIGVEIHRTADDLARFVR